MSNFFSVKWMLQNYLLIEWSVSLDTLETSILSIVTMLKCLPHFTFSTTTGNQYDPHRIVGYYSNKMFCV